jgi:hypothetical protein
MTGKLFIFWDYDTQWGADRSRSGQGRRNWGHLEFENTSRLLEIFARYNLHACFAIVGAAALAGERPYHDPDQIRLIHQHGHEIASHSMYHEWLPGLGSIKLFQTLRDSKDALEQCIGSPVITFVPPFNQPFDNPARWAFSLSERRSVRSGRIDQRRLCETLGECGYQFSRVSYQPLHRHLLERLFGDHRPSCSKLERMKGIFCAWLTGRAGFQQQEVDLVERCVNRDSLALVYGHPHSLNSTGPQSVTNLISFLERVQTLVLEGRLQVVLPRAAVQGRGEV